MKRFLLAVVLVLCCTSTQGQQLNVPADGYSSIQSAINDANDGDIVIVSAGTYQENIDFLGKAITVRSADPNDPNIVATTIIDGNEPIDPNCASVVTFKSSEGSNSVLSGFTITGGTGSWILVSWEFKGLQWNRCGGGAICYNMSAPTISKNVFTANIAGQGSGIYVYGNPVNPNDPSNPAVHISPVITDNIFTNNSAIVGHGFEPPNTNYPCNDHGDGGAIVGFQGCDATITGNLIENNYADMYGGGIHLRQWSNGLIEDNQIIGNDSLLGAGVHITYTSSPTIRDNIIQANTAGPGGGGGIYVYASSNPIIEYNTIKGNTCINGAGIAVYFSSQPLICNNLIVENINGAGIRTRGSDSDPIIIQNTIANNSANINSGGIDCTENSDPIITNNIIASNSSGFGIYSDSISNPEIQYNNVWGNGVGNYNSVIGDQTGVNGNISVDPNFVSNGYWNDANTPEDANDDFFVMGNYHLMPGSACIDAGDNNSVPALPDVDIDNEQRVFNDTIDIGADEFVSNSFDLDNNGIIDYFELSTLTGEWLQEDSELQTDFYEDDFIDFADFAKLAEQWLWKGGWYE